MYSEYFLKDHLGNTRVATAANGTVNTSSFYYPFGFTLQEINSQGVNKYLFGGKELQDANFDGFALNLYDFGARFYDPTLGRWTTPDPLCEKARRWSSFNYAYNNSLRFIDPDGMYVLGVGAGREFDKPDDNDPPYITTFTPEQNEKYSPVAATIALKVTNVVAIGVAMAIQPEIGFPWAVASLTGVPIIPSPQTWAGPLVAIAETTIADEASSVNIATRAQEIHSSLPEATQSRTTTAVASVTNEDGSISYLVGSSETRLRPVQRAVLNSNETAVSGIGHAEVTVINAAREAGQQVNSVAASRPICPSCLDAILNVGAIPSSPIKIPFKP